MAHIIRLLDSVLLRTIRTHLPKSDNEMAWCEVEIMMVNPDKSLMSWTEILYIFVVIFLIIYGLFFIVPSAPGPRGVNVP